MPKTYYNPAKQPTIDVPVKLLSRGRAPLSSDEAIAGRHIDDLTCETDGVGALKKDEWERTGCGKWSCEQLGAPDNLVWKHWPVLFQDFFTICDVINQDVFVEHCS